MSTPTDKNNLTIDEAAQLRDEIESYLVRTATPKAALSRWARGNANAVAMLFRAERPERETARLFRSAMSRHPDGPVKSLGKKQTIEAPRADAHALRKSKIERRRLECERQKQLRHARCRAAHFARYGTMAGFGKPIDRMPA